MKHATTEWIAFLDDDDEVSSDYLTVFRNETESYPSISVILFRMVNQWGRLYPPIGPAQLVIGAVGEHPLTSS
jgi:GT2 family glycosyltransferase